MISIYPFQTYWKETDNLTQQQKLSRKRVRTQPKFCGWLPISKLTCIVQWYKLLLTSNKINTSLQKLLSGNETCEDDTDVDEDGQHEPCVSTMLRRRHKVTKHAKTSVSSSTNRKNTRLQPVNHIYLLFIPYDICKHSSPRSACASTQSHQGLWI